jgi:hypothetical protein
LGKAKAFHELVHCLTLLTDVVWHHGIEKMRSGANAARLDLTTAKQTSILWLTSREANGLLLTMSGPSQSGLVVT